MLKKKTALAFGIAIAWLNPMFAGADDGGGMMNYYKHPSPKEVPTMLAEWQKQGMLTAKNTQLVMIGFLSQVMRDNPTLIQGWLTNCESFPEADKETVLTAAWYSGTPQALDYFKSHNLKQFLNRKAPEPNSVATDDPARLDYYWARYFASGDPVCIRRIISALEYSKYSGSINKFKSSKQTGADKKAAFYDAIFQAAMWSLESNCKRDEKIYSVCKELLFSHQLTEGEKLFLTFVLMKVRKGGAL
jgi:alkylhydroperoxidase/carboxymuconolactone decarboxylase family protein YurZ